MKILSIPMSIATLAAFSVTTPQPANAKEYPYCMNYAAGSFGVIESCSYDTLEQCRLGIGGISGTCFANWRLELDRQAERDAARSSKRKR